MKGGLVLQNFSIRRLPARGGRAAEPRASSPALASDFSPTFLAGADCSNVGYFEARGKVYRDGGKPMDPFAIFKKHGVNCVRPRLFTTSDAQSKPAPYNFGVGQ